jgi:hypothetical protein
VSGSASVMAVGVWLDAVVIGSLSASLCCSEWG